MAEEKAKTKTNPKAAPVDPVCGMEPAGPEGGGFSHSYAGEKFYFCGEECLRRFAENPEKFQGEPLIRMEKIRKSFYLGKVKVEVLKEIAFHIWEGDFVAVIGPSGSGKSTLLNIIGLLDRPTSGRVFFKGKDVSFLGGDERAALRSMAFGFVFQQYNLIPWLTARENAGLPLVFSGRSAADPAAERRLEARFGEMGLEKRMGHRPFELSGGEQQRVALLRALANDPEVILGDEPTGNLDSRTGAKILDALISLNKKEGKTLVIVTHDMDIAEKADQILVLKDGRMERGRGFHKKIYAE